jgi:hypothetical protein
LVQSKVRSVAVITLVVIFIITTVLGICTGDLNKIAAGIDALQNIGQVLALTLNGTSSSSSTS